MRTGFENKEITSLSSDDANASWISLSIAAKETPYSAEYLSLLARKNKISAQKINGIWHTTRSALLEYVKSQKEIRKELNENLIKSKSTLPSSENTPKEARLFLNSSAVLGAFENEPVRDKISISTWVLFGGAVASVSLVAVLAISSIFSPAFSKETFSRVLNEKIAWSTNEISANAFFGTLAGVADSLESVFKNLFGLFSRDKSLDEDKQPVKPLPSKPATSPSVGTSFSVTQTAPTFSIDALRIDLKNELEAYLRTQISSLSPVVIRQNVPDPNVLALYEEILTSYTHSTVTRQSNSDSNTRSRSIDGLTNGGTFSNPTLNNATINSGSFSGETANITTLTVGSCTGCGVGSSASSTLLLDSNNFTGDNIFSNITRSTTTSATTTNFFATNASTTDLRSNTANIGTLTVGSCIGCGGGSSASSTLLSDSNTFSGANTFTALSTLSNLLLTGSSTLQNFTAFRSTSTSATSTNFFATTASSTNLFATSLNTGLITSGTVNGQTISSAANFTGTLTATGGLTSLSNLLMSGSSTLLNFTALQSTSTNATTTNFFATTASSTNLFTQTFNVGTFFQGGFTDCSAEGQTVLYNASTGKFTCGTDGVGGGSGQELNWTYVATEADQSRGRIYVSTTTNQVVIGATATTTMSRFEVVGGAFLDRSTTTSATTTNFFATTASSTNLFATAANFGTASVSGTFNIASTLSSNTGVITSNGNRLIHTFGTGNLFFGINSGNFTLTGGESNIGIGENTLDVVGIGDNNVVIGQSAGTNITSASNNVAIGQNAWFAGDEGFDNVAIGYRAGEGAAGNDAAGNVIIGTTAGLVIDTGANNNVLIGNAAGDAITTGASNIVIGYNQDTLSATQSNFLNIGGSIYGNLGTRNIGLGTTTPKWALQIASSTGPQLTLSDPSTLTNAHWSFRNAGGNLYLGTSSPTTFATSSLPAVLTIDSSSGTVGINTATPNSAYKLEVTGIVRINNGELQMSSNQPIGVSGNGQLIIGDNFDDAVTIQTGSGDDFLVQTNGGAEAFRVTSTGIVQTTGGLLALSSTTLQNFTALQSTSTNATTTNFFATTASTTNLSIGGGTLRIFGTAGTQLSDFCVAITGSASLCDGDDATGAGGSSFGKTLELSVDGDFLSATSSPYKSFVVGATTTASLDRAALFQVNATGTTGTLIKASSTPSFTGKFLSFTNSANSELFSINSSGDLLVTGSTTLQNFTAQRATTSNLVITQALNTSGTPQAFTFTGAAHTGLTASTEATDINFNLARTVQFATGALATQRAMRIQAPTYAFVGASTITNASTLSISGAPAEGSNASITNAHGLRIEAGAATGVDNAYGLYVSTPTGATNRNISAWFQGPVGIGPQALENSQYFSVADSATNGDVQITVSNTSSSGGGSNAVLEAQVSDTSGGDPFVHFRVVEAGTSWSMGVDNSASDAFKISNSNNLGTTDRLTIDSSGVVTISNLLATASSTIGGGATGSGLTIFGGATTTGNHLILGSTTLQNFTAQRATTTRLAITPITDFMDTLKITAASGNPAIQMGTYPSAPDFGGLWLGNAAPTASNYTLLSNGSNETTLNTPVGGSIIFRIGNTQSPNAMTLNATGLGIGIDSPEARLHAYRSNAGQTNLLVIQNGNGATGDTAEIGFSVSSNPSSVTSRIGATRDATGGLIFSLDPGSGMAEKMRLTARGTLGLGTSTPQWALQIASSTGPQLTLSDPSTLTNAHWSFRNAGGNLYLATSSASTFATSTTPAITITSTNVVTFGNTLATCTALTGSAALCDGSDDGAGGGGLPPNSKWATSTIDTLAIHTTDALRVGIGTTTPKWAFQIASSTGPQLTLSDPSTLTNNHWSFRNAGGNFYLATSSATTFASSTYTALTLNGINGHMGVGTSTPWAKLTVVGGLDSQAPSFIVATTSNNQNPGQVPLLFVTATTTGDLDYARVAIGTSTGSSFYGNAGLRDQLTVAGRIYQTWKYLSCDLAGASQALVTMTADTASACGNFMWDLDADSSAVANAGGTVAFTRMRAGLTPSLGDGAAFRTAVPVAAASSSPTFEVMGRHFSGMATNTTIMIGFMDTSIGVDTGLDSSSNGIYFSASSTNNWQAIVRKNGAESRIDTGVASTSSGLPFQRFRIEVASSTVQFLINGQVVAVHTSATTNNIPNANMAAVVSHAIRTTAGGLAGSTREFDLSYMRLWVDDPPTGIGGGMGASPPPPEFDPIEGADIAEAYLTNDSTLFKEGLVVTEKMSGKVGLAETSYDKGLLGIVSTSPRIVLGMETASTTRVAMLGRVPVIVSIEGGAIKKGDRITSSMVQGIGTKARRPGYIVGHALEDWDPAQGIGTCDVELGQIGTTTPITDISPADPHCRAKILVKIETGFDMGIGDVIQDAGLAFADITAAMVELTNSAFEKGAELTKAVFGQIIAKIIVVADLFAQRIFVEDVTAKKLCLEDVCVTKAELQALLNNVGVNGVSGGVGTSTPITNSDPEPEPETETESNPPAGGESELAPPPESSENESPPEEPAENPSLEEMPAPEISPAETPPPPETTPEPETIDPPENISSP